MPIRLQPKDTRLPVEIASQEEDIARLVPAAFETCDVRSSLQKSSLLRETELDSQGRSKYEKTSECCDHSRDHAFFGLVNADAADVKLLSSAGMKPAADVLLPQFERATKNRVVAKYVLTPEVPKLIEGGEIFDVAIANPPHIDALIKSGKVVAGSPAQVARFGLGVGVRAGAPKLNVGTVEGFKQALLKAKSIAYVGAGTSGPLFLSIIEKLGIAKETKDKLRPGGVAENIAAVAKGDVEVVVMPVPLILAGFGVELAGAVIVK